MRLNRNRRQKRDETIGREVIKPENQSLIANALDASSNTELVPIANVIAETIQNLKIKRRALDFAIDEDNDENQVFEAEQGNNREAEDSREQSGHFFTAAEVAQALRRDYPERISSGNEEQGVNGEDGENMKRIGIFGSTAMPNKWSLSNYLQSVASTKEKRVVAVSAWLLALAGLIVALVFVTKDFLESRDELASTVHYVQEERVQLPSLWFCTMGTMMSPFADFPNGEFKGQPLVWIDRIHGLTKDEKMISFPETQQLRQLEVISVNMSGRRCDALTMMDPEIFYEENMELSKCFYCLTISRNPPIELSAPETRVDNRAGNGEEGGEEDGFVGFRVSRHSFIKNCRMRSMGLSRDGLKFFRNQVKKYHVELEKRGILDFGGFDAAGEFADGYLWPDYRFGYKNVTVDWAVMDVADMFCNVYLFSGFFYPSSARDVKYRFDEKMHLWERVGAGPYYPSNFSAQGRRKTSSTVPTTENMRMGEEEYEDLAMYASDSLHVLTNESEIGRMEMLASLEPNQLGSIRLNRRMIRGRESFDGTVMRTTLDRADVRLFNDVYYLDVGFKGFYTQVVSDQMTVSWPAFIADFFGLTSLFLDVSVYTLIVAPLIMRARRRAMVARKMDHKKDAGGSLSF